MWDLRATQQVASTWGCVPGRREGVPVQLRPRFSAFSQRLAYGITPENEHHLVAQRDVRQFQVGAA